jgi:propanediol dehydratase small subunit
MTTHARSGRDVDSVDLDAVAAGQVGADDVRIHPDTLLLQAEVAQRHGNPQLAANFRRAAEIALLDDARVLEIYEALRPGRSSYAELQAIAADLGTSGAPLTAALVAEAAEAYRDRGLSR